MIGIIGYRNQSLKILNVLISLKYKDIIVYCRKKTELVNKQKNILQGDRIEELSYVKKNKLQIDYQFYIDNQIANPSIQFLELFITNPEYLFTNCLSENNTKQMKITSYF